MSKKLELVVLNGPLKGTTIKLTKARPIRIGRSASGLHLPDPHVSPKHAEISWGGDRYWISDTGSSSGTFVDGERLSRAAGLEAGRIIRVGGTQLGIQADSSAKNNLRTGLLAALVVVGGYLAYTVTSQAALDYEPAVVWHRPVSQSAALVSSRIDVPTEFIQRYGQSFRSMRVRRVTDFDGDGLDEVWVNVPGKEVLVQFGPDGSWNVRAELPIGCTDEVPDNLPPECLVEGASSRPQCQAAAGNFPDLRCGISSWTFADGTYKVLGQDGILVYMPPTETVTGADGTKNVRLAAGLSEPWHFEMPDEPTLAGFLADRGVTEPIHYLICEGATREVAAQVLTESGKIKRLSKGCLVDVDVSGSQRERTFVGQRPRMVTFTAAGRDALRQDLLEMVVGSVDPIFYTDRAMVFAKALNRPPIRGRGSFQITFDGPSRAFRAIADEAEITGHRQLEVLSTADTTPPTLGEVAVVYQGKPLELDPPGCSKLQISTSDWHCLTTHGCSTGSSFITVKNTGCPEGGATQVPYAGGIAAFSDGHVDVRVQVQSESARGQTDVIQAKVGWRPAR